MINKQDDMKEGILGYGWLFGKVFPGRRCSWAGTWRREPQGDESTAGQDGEDQRKVRFRGGNSETSAQGHIKDRTYKTQKNNKSRPSKGTWGAQIGKGGEAMAEGWRPAPASEARTCVDCTLPGGYTSAGTALWLPARPPARGAPSSVYWAFCHVWGPPLTKARRARERECPFSTPDGTRSLK